jgi:hypothetical protein
MVTNETRKLMKLLKLDQDEVYHVFCLALCIAQLDGRITDAEGEILTRIGFGFGLDPQDIRVMGQNALDAIRDTSPEDVIAFSIATLQARMPADKLAQVKQLLRYVALSDESGGQQPSQREQDLLNLLDEIWGG